MDQILQDHKIHHDQHDVEVVVEKEMEEKDNQMHHLHHPYLHDLLAMLLLLLLVDDEKDDDVQNAYVLVFCDNVVMVILADIHMDRLILHHLVIRYEDVVDEV